MAAWIGADQFDWMIGRVLDGVPADPAQSA
jgi:hypothetical protein